MKSLLMIIASVFSLTLSFNAHSQKLNIDNERTELRNADAEWSRVTAAKSADGFAAAVIEGGVVLIPNGPALVGKTAIRKWASDLMSNPSYALSWKTVTVDIAEKADLGITSGTFELRFADGAGKVMQDTGKYVTVWRKQSDGKWKVTKDIFNSDLAAPMPVAK